MHNILVTPVDSWLDAFMSNNVNPFEQKWQMYIGKIPIHEFTMTTRAQFGPSMWFPDRQIPEFKTAMPHNVFLYHNFLPAFFLRPDGDMGHVVGMIDWNYGPDQPIIVLY